MTQTSPPLLQAKGLKIRYPVRSGMWGATDWVDALDGVDLRVEKGQTVGIVGESGSGKSTLGRALVALSRVDGGSIHFDGVEIVGKKEKELRDFRRRVGMVFQDPFASFNPRIKVGEAVGEALRNFLPQLDAAGRAKWVAKWLERVGLEARDMGRYPHQFSGGQRQRIAIARALIMGPDLVVADEPVSALDVSVQASILNLWRELTRSMEMASVFITHDLRVVATIADRIVVLYRGRVMEQGPTRALFATPRHPYTHLLREATPAEHPSLRHPPIPDRPTFDPPSAGGCPFQPRCPRASEACLVAPALTRMGTEHEAACHHPLEG
ncbi:MAG: peptide ABC transporter ATP-binding protein [Alphaproteobacteria bacterium CG_4_10_14_0_2_um_filter_63_37]|nr:MAG: hypothetical protein AUJ55_08675 [Proteobacteria bacterium CG1_02_64_396]PJA23870.1 MAG: peptide ABC transporter ATP-binding protein [Alphaproteobacteria bacterium CG_4_10_14_0_2_um_filter_63_37]